MENSKIIENLASLPPEAQEQVIDFIAFLKTRYPTPPSSVKASPGKLANEPFIGMWRDRDDMQDSSAWVHQLRQREWESAT